MKFKLQQVAISEDGKENSVDEIAVLEKDFKSIEHLGLSLSESKVLPKEIQESILNQSIHKGCCSVR